MALEGMDVEAVTPIVSQLGNALSELESVINSTNTAYGTIEHSWVGSDANQFHSQWPSFTSALNQAHNDLQQLHQHLQLNLQAQQQASNQY
jgi:uncharacterized protein YukE